MLSFQDRSYIFIISFFGDTVKQQLLEGSADRSADAIVYIVMTSPVFKLSSLTRFLNVAARQECDAFSMAYDRFLDAMDKDEHDDLF